MPLVTIACKPGVDVEKTPLANAGGWSTSNLIRFFEGMAQKIGGWVALNTGQPITGTARGMHSWDDTSGNAYLAVGTEQRLQVFTSGTLYDITPLRATTNPAVAFYTVINTPTVRITDAAFGGSVGDWVIVLVPVAVGGLVIQGYYLIQTVIGANDYTITAASNATATVGPAGAVPSFNSAGAGAVIATVTLAAHGLSTGQLFSVQVATVLSTVNIAVGDYVATVLTANTFTIPLAGATAGAATVSENGGTARLEYLLPSGFASATPQTGYGVGPYGSGAYGIGSGSVLVPLREWYLANWGQVLLAAYNQSPLYSWTPPATGTNFATVVAGTQMPVTIQSFFIAMTAQIVIALGVDPFGSPFDPLLIRWCNISDYTMWQPTATNQAGSFRIPTGSRLVGGLNAGSYNFIWTDIDMWSIQYLGFPLVFAFNRVATGCGMLCSRGAGIYGTTTYWIGNNNFYRYDGDSVSVIPCTVWDQIFTNLNTVQVEKVFCAVNELFGEITWYYPSATGTGEVDSYVKFSIRESIMAGFPVWDYGSLIRTSWEDGEAFGAPIGADTSGLLQLHEVGADANGQAMMPFVQSGWFQIADGDYFSSIDRVIADFILTGGTAPNNRVFYEVLVADYPTDTPVVYGPYQWTPTAGPGYSVCRARGRVAAIRIYSTDLGVFWRIGAPRFLTAPAGRR